MTRRGLCNECSARDWHSANETHTVIKGTWTFEHEGQRHELGPGGFNYLRARVQHQAWSSDDAPVFITVDSEWDINWVSGPPTKSDLGQRPPTEGAVLLRHATKRLDRGRDGC
jgi:cupin domain